MCCVVLSCIAADDPAEQPMTAHGSTGGHDSGPHHWLAMGLRLIADLKIGIMFSTRLPVGHVAPLTSGDLARASWTFPIVGVLVGAAAAFAYWVSYIVGLPSGPCAALALAAAMTLTGCLHEDGLADTADGFGGGDDRAKKLDIMRDSRLGTYGACVLALSLLLRWSALAAIARPAAVALALVAAHAAARAAMPAFMHLVPPARPDGLSAGAGRPPSQAAIAAAALGAVALVLGLGPSAGIAALLLIAIASGLMALLALRQIGGQTGDVLGALEQANEVIVLLTAAALSRALS
jgi:adenosylcobinamide-GDP ribazoletransferase